MLERDFRPKFYIEHILKDLNLALDVTKSLDVYFPIGAIAQELYSKAVESGLAKEDYSAVSKVLEARSRIEIE